MDSLWSNVIGPVLAPIIQKLNVKTVADVYELLACENIEFSWFFF